MAEKLPDCENVIRSPRVINSFALAETYAEEIQKLINELSENKSCREDDIPVKFIKLSSPFICNFLAYIFNKCVSLGVYPSLLKVAKVIFINKVFEKLIHIRLCMSFPSEKQCPEPITIWDSKKL